MSNLYEFPFGKQEEAPKRPENELRDYSKVRERGLRRGRMDLPFLLLTLLLLATGLVMLLSASFASSYYETLQESGTPDPTSYFVRQSIFAALGIFVMLIASVVPLSFMRRFSVWGFIVSVILLLGVKMAGLTGGGAVRWISIGGQTFQPSELVKAAMALFFADWCARYADRMHTARWGVLPFLIAMGIIGGLLMLQPHLSATIIILGLGVIMMYAGGTKWYWFPIFIAAGWLGYKFVDSNQELFLSITDKFSYIYDRLAAWRDPEAMRLSSGWQIMQSLYAIGSGGLLGQGLGQSRQKYQYLPEEHNDYIFSIICEELGFIGATLILLLFAVLIIRGFWLALHCEDRFDRMLVIGMVSLLTLQVFLNVAVVTNLIPSTGISLPFFSYGGTALLVQMAEIGVILSASRNIPDK